MFSFFKKDPAGKLKKQHMQLLEKAMQAQRNGDIRKYSSLTQEADALHKQVLELEGGTTSGLK